jgi:alpha-L-fucosidase
VPIHSRSRGFVKNDSNAPAQPVLSAANGGKPPTRKQRITLQVPEYGTPETGEVSFTVEGLISPRVRSKRLFQPFLLAANLLLPIVGSQSHAQVFQSSYRTQIEQQVARVRGADARGPFQPNWQSLAAYQTPDWFRDAKFGIFLHWGVYSVPAFANEWYSRNMYQTGNAAFEHHIATYGPQTKFGYKDFIPLFRAEHFDPNAWVDLFVRAGAKYIVPVAEHCDGFPMYDSQFTSWNAAKMGPHRDAVAELEKATRSRGLHFGVSSHRAEHWWWYEGGMRFPSDVRNAENNGLYGPAAPMGLVGQRDGKEPNPSHLERWLPPDQGFLDDWLARSSELVDRYHPDFMYFDWWIAQPAFQPSLQQFAAYYYDRAAARQQGVVLTYKGEAMPANTATLDIERGKMDQLRLLPWQTDTSVSIKSWGYADHDEYRDPKSLIAELVDVVSKNGNMLLNVGPKSDGTIPEEARSVLLAMGEWLQTNGEAIYGTRPWVLYGEGPTLTQSGRDKGSDRQVYASEDIRFTTRQNLLYATALDWPANGQLLIHTLGRGVPYLSSPICSVELLGDQQVIGFRQEEDGLHLSLPSSPPNPFAYVFRIHSGAACSR